VSTATRTVNCARSQLASVVTWFAVVWHPSFRQQPRLSQTSHFFNFHLSSTINNVHDLSLSLKSYHRVRYLSFEDFCSEAFYFPRYS